jgi:hypothetical protein
MRAECTELLWAGWHLPLFLYRGWTSSPRWIYVLFLTGQSVILTFDTNLAHFGIITPIAMHAMLNMVSKFLGGLFVNTRPRAPLPFESVMALSGIATALVLIIATRGRLAYREDPGDLRTLFATRAGYDGGNWSGSP